MSVVSVFPSPPVLASMTVILIAMAAFLALPLARDIPTRRLQKLTPADRIRHHRLQRRLLLPLDRQHRILPDLRHNIPSRIRGLRRRNPMHLSALLQLLDLLLPLQQPIDPPLPEQIALHLLRRARLPARGAAVHPVDAVDALGAARGLLHLLQLLDGALFGALAQHLLDAAPLVERFLFFFPYPPLSTLR